MALTWVWILTFSYIQYLYHFKINQKKMKQKLFIKSILILAFIFTYSHSDAQQKVEKPKLVVGIVVDQMRWDYLYRYADRYGSGGFKRLLNEGFSCNNTFINYLPSYTAVGHSTIFTGSVPAIHGITGNNWIDQQTGKSVYCTDDSTVQSVGTTSNEGKMSPRNLLVTTVTDELRIASNFQSKVIGVSLKDRASILPAGHAANGAYWFDNSSGKFITSTYYTDKLPEWVNRFNDQDIPSKLVSKDWNTLYPISTYTNSTADNVKWEGVFKGEKEPVFPHRISTFYKENKDNIRSTPFGNTLTLDFAKAAVEGNNLGGGAFTDFLTINCASTDYVGHKYGPNSIEVEDTYLRLDKDLADLFSFLDKRLGKGNYTVFLTADHGAANSINFMKEHNLPAGFFSSGKITKALADFQQKKFGHVLLKQDLNYHLGFNTELIDSLGLDYTKIKEETLQFLRMQEGVAFAVDIQNIGLSPVPEPLKTMIINGYNAKRSGPAIVIANSGWFSSGGTGTTHGNWNPYDTHIPLIFMGWGIAHGHSSATYHMTDIAPTISALLHIQMPSGCVGNVITEVVK